MTYYKAFQTFVHKIKADQNWEGYLISTTLYDGSVEYSIMSKRMWEEQEKYTLDTKILQKSSDYRHVYHETGPIRITRR